MQNLERAEDTPVVLGLHADTVVLNPEPNLRFLRLGPNLNVRSDSRSDKLNGVFEQIDNGLVQDLSIRLDLWQRPQDFHCRSFGFEFKRQLKTGSLDCLLEINSA